jgi:hypothetical protein
MRSKLLLAVLGFCIVLWGFTTAIVSGQEGVTALPPTISGVITSMDGVPLPGAIVQIQATTNQTIADANGAFTLGGIAGSDPVVVSAWAEGYHVGWTILDPSSADWNGGSSITVSLKDLPMGDNSEYEWFTFEGVEGSAACGVCHREYSEWQQDAHAQSASNIRFITMYLGTNVNGEVGQRTQMGWVGAQPPDPDKPYFGPGFRLDNYNRAGNCATCHTPVAGTTPNNENCAWSGCHTDLTVERSSGVIKTPVMPVDLRGIGAEGITCEFCHKIGDVLINPDTGLPPSSMPGILSVRLHRPEEESMDVFFGPLIDVQRPDSYLPLQSESQFCAACHYGVFGGVVGMDEMTGGETIYNTYGEWLNSPYSDPETGKTCQDCHMPVSDANWFVYPERGGFTRDYQDLHNHTMLGVEDEILMQNSVTMTSTAERIGDQIQVDVSIRNDKTGHHVPSDAPIRSLILVVEALDADGNPLALTEGSVNPEWSGDLGGLPGKTFAKVLRDEWTGEAPTAAFWRTITLVEDTRIAAMATDSTSYTFAAPAGAVTVNVRLVFRRAFYEVSQLKGWNDPDILMEHETLQLPAN